MSDEYINKDNVIEIIEEECPIYSCDTRMIIIDRICDLPRSYVAKHGKWLWYNGHFCSECRKKAKSIVVDIKLVDNYYCHKSEPITEYKFGEFLSDFCPNCGADMRGADNESD